MRTGNLIVDADTLRGFHLLRPSLTRNALARRSMPVVCLLGIDGILTRDISRTSKPIAAIFVIDQLDVILLRSSQREDVHPVPLLRGFIWEGKAEKTLAASGNIDVGWAMSAFAVLLQ